LGYLDTAVLYSAEISQYWNLEYFLKNGFEEVVTLTQDLFETLPNKTTYAFKEISQQRIKHYGFKWLDLSNFNLIDFG